MFKDIEILDYDHEFMKDIESFTDCVKQTKGLIASARVISVSTKKEIVRGLLKKAVIPYVEELWNKKGIIAFWNTTLVYLIQEGFLLSKKPNQFSWEDIASGHFVIIFGNIRSNSIVPSNSIISCKRQTTSEIIKCQKNKVEVQIAFDTVEYPAQIPIHIEKSSNIKEVENCFMIGRLSKKETGNEIKLLLILTSKKGEKLVKTREWQTIVPEVLYETNDKKIKIIPTMMLPQKYVELKNRYEKALQDENLAEYLKKSFNDRIDRVDKMVENTNEDIKIIASKMGVTGFSSSQIYESCCMYACIMICDIYSEMDETFPHLEDSEGLLAFLLGCEKSDIRLVGFVSDKTSMLAPVPKRYMDKHELVPGSIVTEFQYELHPYEQKELWCKYVIPFSVAKYGADYIEYDPVEIEKWGIEH